MCRQVARGIVVIIKARKVLCNESPKCLYYSFIYPYNIYCNQVWGPGCKTNIESPLILEKGCMDYSSCSSQILPVKSAIIICHWVEPTLSLGRMVWDMLELLYGTVFLMLISIQTPMMTTSNGNDYRVTGPLWQETTVHRWIPLTKPGMRSFGIFFDLRNKRLSKQSGRRWFDTPLRSLWRHCNGQWIYLL